MKYKAGQYVEYASKETGWSVLMTARFQYYSSIVGDAVVYDPITQNYEVVNTDSLRPAHDLTEID